MLADVEAAQNGYIARFERFFPHPVKKVWSMLTDNEELSKWFPELRVEDLREGGVILFDMQDGTRRIIGRENDGQPERDVERLA
jgi:uncharacterized protein YndB with AHSA1/START domain